MLAVPLTAAGVTAAPAVAATTYTTAAAIAVGGYPDAVGVDPSMPTVYVGTQEDGVVSIDGPPTPPPTASASTAARAEWRSTRQRTPSTWLTAIPCR
jgi:hypothetical protein